MTRSDLGQIVTACAVATTLILGACGPSNRPRQLVNTGGKAPDTKLAPEGGLVTTPVCEGAISATIKDYRTKLAAANSPSKALLDQIKSVAVNVGDDGQPSTIVLNGDSKSSVSLSGGTINGLKVTVQKTSAMKGADPKDSACENSYLIAISRGEGAQAATVYATAVVLGATVKVSGLICEGGSDKKSELDALAKSLSESKTGKNTLILTTLVSGEGKKSQGFAVGGAGLKMGFSQSEVKADAKSEAKSEAKSVVDADSVIAESASAVIYGTTSGATQTKETIDFRMQLDLSKGTKGETKQLTATVSAARDGKSSGTGIAFSGPEKCDAKETTTTTTTQLGATTTTQGQGTTTTTQKATTTTTQGTTPTTQPTPPTRPTTPTTQPAPVVAPTTPTTQPAPIVVPPPAPAANAKLTDIQGLANSMVVNNGTYVQSNQAVTVASASNMVAQRNLDESPTDTALIAKQKEAKEKLERAIATRDAQLASLRASNSTLKTKVEDCNKDSACKGELAKALGQNGNNIQKALDLKF